jgi:hypothetical protein
MCGENFGHVTGKVVHTAAGYVREYILGRVDDSGLVKDLLCELGGRK